MKTICLTGMMGSGKTSVAEIFAKNKNLRVVDIDSMIEKSEKMSVSEIFAQKGENYFRKVEQKIIFDLFEEENLIISLGGGAFENPKTREFLLANSKVVYLKTSPEVIYERIKNDTSRPLLCGKMNLKNISDIINKREKNYASAHKIIVTDNKTPQDISMELDE